jgi:type I restriction enzyme S subunit
MKPAIFDLFNIRGEPVQLKKVMKASRRLDASVYLSCGLLETVKGDGILADIAEVKQAIVFGKRNMQGIEGIGIPLFSGSEISMHEPQPSCYLRSEFQNILKEKLFAERGTILMTLSGTVGTVTMINSRLLNVALTDDVMRIKCHDPNNTGFVYTYLRSPICQQNIKSLAYGAVIQHLKQVQIEQIPLSNISLQTKQELNQLISRSIELREEAYILLNEAYSNLYKVNSLIELNENNAPLIEPESQLAALTISTKTVWHPNGEDSEYRLDAHFYNPLAQLALKNIKACRSEVKPLHEVTENVFMCNRSTRNYVDCKYGIPYLSGKNIVQIRPTDLKYISLSETLGLNELKLEKGWILVTRTGTMGRTCMVWENYENYTASDNIIRVVPKENTIDSGYLCAFLSSQYGKILILRNKSGSVIDYVTPEQLRNILIPLPSQVDQRQTGNLVRSAYEKRADAIRLEDEAQQILMNELTYGEGSKGE